MATTLADDIAVPAGGLGALGGDTSPKLDSDGDRPAHRGKMSTNGVFAVKIDNIAAGRPQVRLDAADLVVVEQVEGALTRLVGIFHTRFPPVVGPVRSARNTDVQLLSVFARPGPGLLGGQPPRAGATAEGTPRPDRSARTATTAASPHIT